jgi:hypothetical protein
MTIETRQADLYEACYWTIGVDDYSYMDGAYIELSLSSLDFANIYVYHGTDRKNLTSFIEYDLYAAVGAPYLLPISAKTIIVS